MPVPALRTVALVLAGGTGTRIGAPVPKQLLELAGRTVLEHTVRALHDCAVLDELRVVMHPDHVDRAEALLRHADLPRLVQVLPGGRDRDASTRLALAALGDEECNVLVHDAVRPLVSQRLVESCVAALRTAEAVTVAVPSTDTVLRVDADDRVVDVPDRSLLRRSQTPQGFRLSVLRRAYALAASDPRPVTDNVGVVLRHLPDVPVQVVPGDEHNLKITHSLDLLVADELLRRRQGPPAQSSA